MYLARLVTPLVVCSLSVLAATFGTAVSLVGGASDLALDEARGRLYLVNGNQSRVEVYSTSQRRFLNPVSTDTTPLAAAMSRSGKYLYVTSYDASSLNVIDLDTLAVVNRVSLPAKPEGVAVGNDERVLISTIGTGAGNASNVLLVYDPKAANSVSITNLSVIPPAATTPVFPAPSGRPYLQNRSQLSASRDGSIIVGVNVPAAVNTQTVFVYEVGSATILGSRTLTGAAASTVIAASPDGSKFMSGSTLFDSATMRVLAQQNLANSLYPIAPGSNFATLANQGGSVFSPDGSVLYSAYNIPPVQNPAARSNIAQLMFNDPDNLLIGTGLQLPESLSGKMIVSGDGGNIYALSESGFTIIPMSTMAQSPIAVPESTVAAIASDQCGVTSAQRTARITVRNAGRGNLTATAQAFQYGTATPTAPAPVVSPPGTGTAATLFQTAPTVRTQQSPDGTAIDFTFSAAAARSIGTIAPGHDFLIQSAQAINIPPQVHIYQNSRNAEAVGDLFPIPIGISSTEGLTDLAYDGTRQRLYIANSGRNRVEIFDVRQRRLLDPIKAGQLPRSIALSPDGATLYVANAGGEQISIIDTDKLQVVGRAKYPPIPINATQAIVTPSVIVAHQSGAMFLTSAGQFWDITGGQIVPRRGSAVIGSTAQGQPRPMTAPFSMASTPNGERVIVLSGDGSVYLYDALADDFIQSRQVFTAGQTGYFGPVTAGPRGQYFAVNGSILNEALTAATGGGGGGAALVAAVAAAGQSTYVRFTQPVRANATAVTTDAGSFDVVDVATGQTRLSVPALEGPTTQAIGAARAVISGRTLAVDAAGTTVYALTTTGLSILSLSLPNAADRPQISARGAVNLASYQTPIAPNGLLSIFGRNLGAQATSSSLPLPTLLGGVCVTLGTTALPLFATSAGQINAQIPPEIATGTYALTVRSIDKKIASASQSLAVSKYAPAVLVDPQTQQTLLFHSDGRLVNKDHPAHRDEPLVMYALGLGPTKGGAVTSGAASPSSPLAVTDPVSLFFGNPEWKQAAIIVDWSGLTPGFVGLYQINLRVPGDHINGDALPVLLKVGNVSSPTSGPLVPTVSVQ